MPDHPSAVRLLALLHLLHIALLVLLPSRVAVAGGQLDTVTFQYTEPHSKRPLPLRPQAITPHFAGPSLRFGPLPCDCQGEEVGCGCCAGLSMSYLNWNRRACFNLTYDPLEFAFGFNLLMDGESVFKNSISGKNPPPACVPIPTPLPVLPTVDFCVRMFNVFTPTPGVNLHACMNFETRISRAPVLVLEFDCLRLGSAGVFALKPEDYGEIPEPTAAPEEGEEGQEGQEGEDTYDEVTEDRLPQNVTEAPTEDTTLDPIRGLMPVGPQQVSEK